ncbi:MAG: hypothetical protein FWC15_04375 [Fibromonadales bacterium]|nr:hypothetical protein [Fibromonadales bacterium]
MQFKFGIIAVAFILASCTSDLPDVPKFEFCYIPSATNSCQSFYEVSRELCEDLIAEDKAKLASEPDCADAK